MQIREEGWEGGSREARAVIIFRMWVTGCRTREGPGGMERMEAVPSLGGSLERKVWKEEAETSVSKMYYLEEN